VWFLADLARAVAASPGQVLAVSLVSTAVVAAVDLASIMRRRHQQRRDTRRRNTTVPRYYLRQFFVCVS
jgi:hypothetical protein